MMNNSKFTAPLIFLLLVSTSISGCLGEKKSNSDNENDVSESENGNDSGNETGNNTHDNDLDTYNVLYIGHSFGRPFAEQLENFSAQAGITNHTQHIVFSGGASGAPDRLWADDKDREKIKTFLDTGEIDVLIMICCSKDFPPAVEQGRNSTDEAMWNFTFYALEQNPNTRIGLALMWPDFPEEYENVSEFRKDFDEVLYPAWKDLASRLSSDFPDADVFTFYHGAALHELREMYEEGNLSDVEQMTGAYATSLFTDAKGHAGQIAIHTGTLLWLAAIHDVEPSTFPEFEVYETDIRLVAQRILDEQKQL